MLRHILRLDRHDSPEFRLLYPGAPKAIQFHIYQPPRKVSYALNGVIHKFPDISGEDRVPGGYNERALQTSYMPLLRGILRKDGNRIVDSKPTEFLTNPYISWNMFGVTADEIKYKHPKDWHEFHDKVVRAGVRPIGETYFHPIFPLLPDETKRMLIRFAKHAYKETWGHEMQFTWLPEMAVDQKTLDVLADEGIKGVLLRRGQVNASENSPVYSIKTKGNKSILAFVSDEDLSGKIAFHNNVQADGILNEWAAKKDWLGHTPLVAMDGETFGEHWKAGEGAFQFLAWMVHYLEEAEMHDQLDFSMPLTNKIPRATLAKDISAWSCAHGVDRWNGGSSCNEDLPNDSGMQDMIHRQKRELYENIMRGIKKTDQTLDLIDKQTRTNIPWRTEFNYWLNSQRKNIALGLPLEATHVRSEYKELFLAEALLLIGTTSCGWFFGGEFERRLPREVLVGVSELMGWKEIRPEYTLDTLSSGERKERERFFQNELRKQTIRRF